MMLPYSLGIIATIATFCSAHVAKCSVMMHVTSTSGNDTHCRLLSLWIILACRLDTMLYYVHKQYIFICTLQDTLAYKLTYGRCDMHMLCILIWLLHYKLICWDWSACRASTNASIIYKYISETCKNCTGWILEGYWPIERLLTSVGRSLSIVQLFCVFLLWAFTLKAMTQAYRSCSTRETCWEN